MHVVGELGEVLAPRLMVKAPRDRPALDMNGEGGKGPSAGVMLSSAFVQHAAAAHKSRGTRTAVTPEYVAFSFEIGTLESSNGACSWRRTGIPFAGTYANIALVSSLAAGRNSHFRLGPPQQVDTGNRRWRD
jgi:hypothetical protein